VKKLIDEVKKLKIGDGFESSSNIGPMISNLAVEKVEILVAEAIKSGAKCAIGGKKVSGQFFAPTVLIPF
jgi:succinate-semialdehyde dehydrogenase/glutarate-semialdehyde dehydrogenase